jgi:hypothetical protein
VWGLYLALGVTWAGYGDMGASLMARAHAMGAAVVEEGGGSDGQGQRASESGCARARSGADGVVPLDREREEEEESKRAGRGADRGARLSADAGASWAERPRMEGVWAVFLFS